MTIITDVRGIDVSRRFTRGRRAVMATAARPRHRHTAMIKNRRKPAGRYMAIVAGVGAGNMSGSLTTCSCAVMAIET